jgi:hypothetical protein
MKHLITKAFRSADISALVDKAPPLLYDVLSFGGDLDIQDFS